MLTVLNVVAPVFAIVAFGYLMVRFKLYPASGVQGLLTFVNSFVTPFLLFRAMLTVDFGHAFHPHDIGKEPGDPLVVAIESSPADLQLFEAGERRHGR